MLEEAANGPCDLVARRDGVAACHRPKARRDRGGIGVALETIDCAGQDIASSACEQPLHPLPHDLGDRVVRDPLAVRRTAPAKHGRRLGELPDQLSGQTRLADSRFADEG